MQAIDTFIIKAMSFLQEKRNEAGQTLVEYALIIALISLLVVALATILRQPLTDTFQSIADGLAGS